MTELAQRFRGVRERLRAACQAAGRRPEEVRLIAVSKRHGADRIREAYELGQRDFGENYVQELTEKAKELADLPDLRWHMIGHLQRNKAASVVGVARALHTLDSLRLLQAVARRVGPERALELFLAVNLGGEAQKHGCPPEEVGALVQECGKHPQLRLQGLMAIPPAASDPEETRPYFRQLAELAAEHRLPRLSMGMTADFEVAVAEGATEVRVGTALFGARNS